jgi:predicted RNA binding protein YcfA (HicA-like mRNA interferase family)
VTSTEIIRRIKAAGWAELRVKGSHHHFRHSSRPGTVTVVHPVKDVPIGTLRSIKAAGWRRSQ